MSKGELEPQILKALQLAEYMADTFGLEPKVEIEFPSQTLDPNATKVLQLNGEAWSTTFKSGNNHNPADRPVIGKHTQKQHERDLRQAMEIDEPSNDRSQ